MINSPSMITSPQQTFDQLFYKRLQHIERVLDEDPLELEKFKNYFQSVVNTKRSGNIESNNQSTIIANILLNSNTKEQNLSQERVQMNQTHRSPQLSNQSLNTSGTNLLPVGQHKRGNSTIDNYPPEGNSQGMLLLKNQKKVVYQVQQ